MRNSDKDVRHDAASLYRFVDSVCSSCERRGHYPAYLEANRSFIDYVCELGEATKTYLRSFPDKLKQTPLGDYNSARQELLNLRISWFELHRRVKPASDADTLHLPFPLIRALVHRFREIEEFKKTRFVVIHTERLNYLQVSASGVRGTANNIAGIVHYRRFDKTLGMIGIPYSQSGSLFLNCLIAHELAHYAFTEKKIATNLAPDSHAALVQAFAGVTGLTRDFAQRISNVLADWAEELFCDLFAVRIVGPSFSYAFIEIFDLTNDLDVSGGLHQPAATEDARFSATHPADLFRLKQHVAFLDELGWWADMAGADSHYVKLLSMARVFPDSEFKVPIPDFQSYETNLLQALFKLMPAILKAVRDVVGPLDIGLQQYLGLRATLDKYFVLGIVPSSIPGIGTQPPGCPKPLTILNVAYRFYLEKLDALIGGVKDDDPLSVSHRGLKDQDPLSVKDREYWGKRVEMWAMKAIDDYLLVNKVRGV